MQAHRLVVNPNSPQAWEIQLKPGSNSLGRGDTNDFKIADPSVSTNHCCVVVTDGAVVINDLGSTNGTFVNLAPVQSATLTPGHTIRLGQVELLLHSDAPADIASSPQPRMRPAGLRISGSEHAAPVEAPPAIQPHETESAPPLAEVNLGKRFCKFHPKSAAHYLCNKCNRTFCELCVTSRNTGGHAVKTCRSCGVECVPLHMEYSGPAQAAGFFPSLPGTFVYPFKGSGILVLIVATLLFAGLAIMSAGWMSILMKMVAMGYLFSYMQGIIHATAAEEQQMPELPGMDGLFGAFFSLAGTVLMSFGIAIGLGVARFFFDVEAIPMSAIIAAVVLGCLYFPMAFLAAAMKDTALAANPLVVVPAILKVPVPYLVTVILMTSIFGIQRLGDMISSGAGSVSLSTTSMSVMFMAFGLKVLWNFFSVYLLTVNMRILGVLYVAEKDKLAWF